MHAYTASDGRAAVGGTSEYACEGSRVKGDCGAKRLTWAVGPLLRVLVADAGRRSRFWSDPTELLETPATT